MFKYVVLAIMYFLNDNREKNPLFPSTSEERLQLKNKIYSIVDNALVPVEYFKHMFNYCMLCYDSTGNGYNGIKREILERLNMAKRFNLALPLDDFFKHTANIADMIDASTQDRIEIKTGCGAWLYGNTDNLEEVRKTYEESNDFIKWDYVYKAKNEKEFDFSIHIFTTWSYFFRYLDTYDKGFQSFFKYNRIKSVQMGSNVFDMNTLKTSKKKVLFLRNFTEID